MLYELINPSDKYTFEASCHEAAALAVFIILTAVWHGGEFIYFQF